MCGEFAGDEKATALLFGMGLDAFSMSAISVPRIKQNILNIDRASAKAFVDEVMNCATTEEVLAKVEEFYSKLKK